MESLNQLIEHLQQLHLEQERILQALENITQESMADQEPSADIEPVAGVESVAGVVSSAVAVVGPASLPATSVPVAVPVPVPTVTAFHIGKQVYITNHISHVLVHHATEANRTAIVTHFTASRVAIRTINGYHTHRHPKNLRPL
jgi:hypothetical protein